MMRKLRSGPAGPCATRPKFLVVGELHSRARSLLCCPPLSPRAARLQQPSSPPTTTVGTLLRSPAAGPSPRPLHCRYAMHPGPDRSISSELLLVNLIPNFAGWVGWVGALESECSSSFAPIRQHSAGFASCVVGLLTAFRLSILFWVQLNPIILPPMLVGLSVYVIKSKISSVMCILYGKGSHL